MSPDRRVDFWAKLIESSRARSLIWASGLIDPNLSESELMEANFQLPREAVRAIQGLKSDVRFVAIGTVLEELGQGNPYVLSKLAFSNWLGAQSDLDYLYLRTHTLIGRNPPPKHMFLGSLLSAHYSGAVFHMSSGRQLRTYIDVDRFAKELASDVFLYPLSPVSGVKSIGGPVPCQLREVATEFRKKMSPGLRIEFDRPEPKLDFYPENSRTDDLAIGARPSLEICLERLTGWMKETHTRI